MGLPLPVPDAVDPPHAALDEGGPLVERPHLVQVQDHVAGLPHQRNAVGAARPFPTRRHCVAHRHCPAKCPGCRRNARAAPELCHAPPPVVQDSPSKSSTPLPLACARKKPFAKGHLPEPASGEDVRATLPCGIVRGMGSSPVRIPSLVPPLHDPPTRSTSAGRSAAR